MPICVQKGIFYEKMVGESHNIRCVFGAVLDTSVCDRTNTADRADVVPNAHSCAAVRFFVRLAMGTVHRLYCATAAIGYVWHAAVFSNRSLYECRVGGIRSFGGFFISYFSQKRGVCLPVFAARHAWRSSCLGSSEIFVRGAQSGSISVVGIFCWCRNNLSAGNCFANSFDSRRCTCFAPCRFAAQLNSQSLYKATPFAATILQ